MNIKGQGHSLTFVQGHSDSTFSNFFSLEIPRPNEAKFHVEPLWVEGIKVNTIGLYIYKKKSHMTKMTAMSICGKNLKKIFFSVTKRPMILKLGIQHQVLEYNQICSNDDTVLTMTIFITSSNLFPNASVWVKAYTAYNHTFPSLF